MSDSKILDIGKALHKEFNDFLQAYEGKISVFDAFAAGYISASMKFSMKEEIKDIVAVLESLNRLEQKEILTKANNDEFLEIMLSSMAAIPKILVSAVNL